MRGFRSYFPHNPETKTVVFLGSSTTQTDYSGASWRNQAMAWLNANKPSWMTYSFLNSAGAGADNAPWDMALNLWTRCLNFHPSLIVLDTVLDTGSQTDWVAVEAMLRKIWQTDHATRVIFMGLPVLSSLADSAILTPTNATQMTNTKAICSSYGAAYADVYAALYDLVVNQYHHLTEYYDSATILGAAGHNLAFATLTPLLAGSGKLIGLPGGDRFDRWVTISPASQTQVSRGWGTITVIPTAWAQTFHSAGLSTWPYPSAPR
jgi:hypothetical protein